MPGNAVIFALDQKSRGRRCDVAKPKYLQAARHIKNGEAVAEDPFLPSKQTVVTYHWHCWA